MAPRALRRRAQHLYSLYINMIKADTDVTTFRIAITSRMVSEEKKSPHIIMHVSLK